MDADARPRWLDAGLGLEDRVRALVDDLTGDDLTAVALGDFAPLTGRGLPAPDYVDAGTGLRDVEGATAFPAMIALAATFDAGVAEEYGRAVGVEARASGFSVVLGPTIDLARDPRAGRIPEALGEDPYLAGLLGAAHVRGLQSQHVIAQSSTSSRTTARAGAPATTCGPATPRTRWTCGSPRRCCRTRTCGPSGPRSRPGPGR